MQSIKTLEENVSKMFINLKGLSKPDTKSRDHKDKGGLYKCMHTATPTPTHHEEKKGPTSKQAQSTL